MCEQFDRSIILQRLDFLDRKDPKRRIFGASEHQYKLNPPRAIVDIEKFEARHGIALPEDYRFFISQIGDGGAGPSYGLFPFGKDDEECDWEGGGLVGDLSKPFSHKTAWNQPESFWACAPDPAPGTPAEEEDKLYEAWDKVMEEHYWNPSIMNGAIPICHKGCALRQWLVVSGDQRGFVWDDYRADHAGIMQLIDTAGKPVTFVSWYMSWIDECVRAVPRSPFADVKGFWSAVWRRFVSR
jgi:hypothetical protein